MKHSNLTASNIKRLIWHVQKPARYLGGEANSVRKPAETVELSMALAFPDIYEVGMSHLGLQILYDILNRIPWVQAGRVYAPWPDYAALLRAEHIPLYTLETYSPLNECDVVGFSLQHEMCYTTVLNMLDLGGIPLRGADRPDAFPLVIAGGPAVGNPEPMAPFMDAMLLGEGERAVVDIAEVSRQARREGWPKHRLLRALAGIDGVYVPSLFSVQGSVATGDLVVTPAEPGIAPPRRRIEASFDTLPAAMNPVIPWITPIQDRVSIEVQRGCTHGCRFCQAGMLYRPVRQRSPETVDAIARQAVAASGADTVSLLSLSVGDYRPLEDLVNHLSGTFDPKEVTVSLPSLRVEALTPNLVEQLSHMRKAGFTLAPEAGSDRLRRVINKGNTEEDLLRSIDYLLDQGFRRFKLYFMIGLPTETDEDIEQTIDLLAAVSRRARSVKPAARVAAAFSTFVPKAHTPFQWEAMIGYDEIVRKQQHLRAAMHRLKIEFRDHHPRLSLLEGVLARGDRRIADVIEAAVENGCYLDAWHEHFRLEGWDRAFETAGVDPGAYRHVPWTYDRTLPWNHLDFRLKPSFLEHEHRQAMAEAVQPDCSYDVCFTCGVCDHRVVKREVMAPGGETTASHVMSVTTPEKPQRISTGRDNRLVQRMRVRFEKKGPAAYLGHLEMAQQILRAIRRAGIRVRYSQGFHPQPRLAFSPALPMGVDSACEFIEIDLSDSITASKLLDAVNRRLPQGLRLLDARPIELTMPTLGETISGAVYRFDFSPLPDAADIVRAGLARYASPEPVMVTRTRKRKVTEFDLKQRLASVLPAGDTAVDVHIVFGEGGSAKPLEILQVMFGLGEADALAVSTVKMNTLFDPRMRATENTEQKATTEKSDDGQRQNSTDN